MRSQAAARDLLQPSSLMHSRPCKVKFATCLHHGLLGVWVKAASCTGGLWLQASSRQAAEQQPTTPAGGEANDAASKGQEDDDNDLLNFLHEAVRHLLDQTLIQHMLWTADIIGLLVMGIIICASTSAVLHVWFVVCRIAMRNQSLTTWMT